MVKTGYFAVNTTLFDNITVVHTRCCVYETVHVYFAEFVETYRTPAQMRFSCPLGCGFHAHADAVFKRVGGSLMIGAITDFETPRRNMVESQIRTNKVTDPALVETFSTVPRELFVPDRLSSLAYADEDIEIAPRRYLMEPLVLARLLQTAGVTEDDMVLDIGCGTGYSTAVLSNLANTVVAVESDPKLASHAGSLLSQLDMDNAVVMTGPLEQGYPPQAPYDVIVMGGGVATIPEAILEQLAEGGRLVAVLQEGEQLLGKGTLMIGRNGNYSRREIFDAAVPPLPGFSGDQSFQF